VAKARGRAQLVDEGGEGHAAGPIAGRRRSWAPCSGS
jgi:hypothetical protein